MPREQLQLLTADVDRLLAAGSSVAAGDEGLRRRGKALRELGQKVPVLVQIADAVDRTADAPPKQVGPALLDLLLIIRQVRASLAGSALDGGFQAAEQTGPWTTAMPMIALEPLCDGLMGSKYGRSRLVKKALTRPDFTDLRLLDPLLRALGANDYMLARVVAEKALPAFGKPILGELERTFDLAKGKAPDARRLVAICAIDPKKGAALCRQALTEGSNPVKVQGLKSLSVLAPEETEKAALMLLDQKASEQVHGAAYYALATGKTDDALEALLKGMLSNKWSYHHVTHNSLRKLQHPKATARLLEELDKALEDVKTRTAAKKKRKPGTKGKTKAQIKAEQDEERKLNEAIGLVARLINVLGQRRDKKAVGPLIDLLGHANPNIRETASGALIASGERAALDAVANLIDDKHLWHHAIRAAWQLPPKERFDRLAPALATLSDSKPSGRYRGENLLGFFSNELHLLGGDEEFEEEEPEGEDEDQDQDEFEDEDEFWDEDEYDEDPTKPTADWDPRWVPALRKHLKGPKQAEVAVALTVLEREKMIPDLLKLLVPTATKGNVNVLQALGHLRVREAVPELVKLFTARGTHPYWISEALRRIGDPAAIPLLEKVLDKTKDNWKKHTIESLIESLEDIKRKAAKT
jgi:HEAT repeat protein